MKLPDLDQTHQKLGWWAYIALFLLFPVVFHPWWLAIILLAAYTFLVVLLLRKKPNSK